MKAFRFEQWQTTATLKDVPQPEPGPGELSIRIGGAGARHSDLHIMHEWTPESFPQLADWPLPFTLGHENAGWIEGGDHEGFDVGAPVVITPHIHKFSLDEAVSIYEQLEANQIKGRAVLVP